MVRQLNSLQSIRAFATIFVLLYHSTILFKTSYNYEFMYDIFSFGYAGVDIFFVLSGFLMFFLHSSDIGNSKVLKTFILKRFIRIYPIYWVVLLIIIFLNTFISNLGTEDSKDFINVLKSFILIPQSQDDLLLSVSWTLSYEIFFYLCFCLLFIFNKNLRIILGAVWIIVFIVLLFINVESYIVNFLFDPINFEFLLGVLIARIVLSKSQIKYSLYYVSGLIFWGFAILIEIYQLIEINRVIQFGIPSTLIIMGVVSKEISGTIKKSKVLTYLGDASYSIYLTHYLLLSFLAKIFNSLNLFNLLGYGFSIILISITSLLLGCIFHMNIEKPMLKLLKTVFINKFKNDSNLVKINKKSSIG